MNSEKKYKAIRERLYGKQQLIPFEEVFEPSNRNIDYYESLYFYNDSQLEKFKQQGNSVSGITDVVTDLLYFDFDCEKNLESAKTDAINFCNKLISLGINKDSIQTWFSGCKGFGVAFFLDHFISPVVFKNVVFNLGAEFSTFDKRIFDTARVIRLENTKHPETDLYKIPLTINELSSLTIEEIREKAKISRIIPFNGNKVTLDPKLFETYAPIEKVVQKIQENTSDMQIDFKNKLKGWTNCKWALTQGYEVKAEQRHEKLVCIIATAKALNNTKEQAYYLAKNADRQGSEYYNCERVDKKDLWRIVESVYHERWKGGTYTCKDNKTPWLAEICQSLGPNKCTHQNEETAPIRFIDLAYDFKEYVKNIEKNTIKTGIESLDKHIFLSTGANVGIVAASGAGKTTIALEILNNTSLAGVRSVVASLDMAKNRIFEKIMYRLSGLGRQELYQLFKDNKEADILAKLNTEFGNVNFFKQSCPTVQDIKDYVVKCNEDGGQKVKLVIIDYFERITSDFADDTAASKKIAGELQDLVDDLDICLITLVQPNKNAIVGGPDSPIYDYSKIKGSSFLYQAFRIILSCWRPFYNPKKIENDKYLQLAVLKNDLGELNEFAYGWDGKRGKIRELEDFELDEFDKLLLEKEQTSNKMSF